MNTIDNTQKAIQTPIANNVKPITQQAETAAIEFAKKAGRIGLENGKNMCKELYAEKIFVKRSLLVWLCLILGGVVLPIVFGLAWYWCLLIIFLSVICPPFAIVKILHEKFVECAQYSLFQVITAIVFDKKNPD